MFATRYILRTSKVTKNVDAIRRIHLTPFVSGAPHGDDPIKNFMDFKWPNQVTTFEHYKMPQDLLDVEYNYPVCQDTMGIRWPGYWFKKKFVYVAEMEPELVVPDLDGFTLKPYVSYRTEEIDTPPFTAKNLFDAVYANDIIENVREGKELKFDIEQQHIDQARLKAMQTGSDLFEDHTYKGVRAPMEFIKYIDV